MTQFRQSLETALDTQFAFERFSFATNAGVPLTLDPANPGRAGSVTPVSAIEQSSDVNTIEYRVTIQLWDTVDLNDPQPDNSPPASIIEAFGDRVVTAVKTVRNSGVGGPSWFLRVTGIRYQSDEAGDITRLEADVLGYDFNAMAP